MPDSRAVDREARRTIREDLHANLLVEAGAGSGKTQMLAERMAVGVASGAYRIEHMAAVTFTRKAASELRGRFHLALEHQLLNDDTGQLTDDAAARVHAALSNLERFFAGTIHAFCARLLRERPVESGVAPGFTELDEVQDLDLRRRVWREFIASARAAGDADVLALLDAGVRPGDLDGAFATVCLHDDVEFPPGDAACPDTSAAAGALEAFWQALQHELPNRFDEATTCRIQKAAATFRGQIRVSRSRLDRPSVLANLLRTWDCESTIIQKWWADTPAEKKRIRDRIATLHGDFRTATVAPFLAQWRQYVYRLAVSVLMSARHLAAAERRRLNSLNYGDLLNLAARVLRQNPQVRRALQGKFRHLFVDEFQDTDPVQAEIVFLLAADPTAAITEPPDWREVPLRPGALFVVGDPKQSIYRFRRADIDIYNIVRARLEAPGVGRVLPLTMNFRSVSRLCTWANRVFASRFPAQPTAHAPRFAALDPHDDRTTIGGTFTLTHTCARADVPVEDAGKIARYIRSEVAAGRRAYKDFLILTRKKRDRIAPYADALEALNIPIEVSGAGAFGNSAEVATLTALLRALADPQDPLPLLAVLRGPLFGLSDPDLFAYKRAGGWFSLFADAQVSAGIAVRDALAVLQQFYRWTRVLPAPAALDRVLEASGYLALAATTPGGVDAGDIVHAVDRVRQVVEDGGSLADAADALDDDREATSEVESLPLEPGRSDVVRVMNLHKAKGLEAAVVFLSDPTGGFSPRVDVHVERNGLTAQGWFRMVRSSAGYGGVLLGEHKDWAAHEAAELPYLLAEDDRLLYVAATRAREMLVVSRWTGKHPAWGVLDDFLPGATELPTRAIRAAHPPVPGDCSESARVAAEADRGAAHDRVRRASWSVSSVTAEDRHIAHVVRSAEPEVDDPTRVVRTDTPAHRADAGQAWGTLIHGLLEHAMRHPSASRDDLRRLAMWLTVEEPQLRTVIDRALDTVAAAAAADFWTAAQKGEHAAEAPFTVADSEQRLTTGVIDLMYRSGASWRIVDYKTDVDLDVAIYQKQLDTYSAALRQVGCDVADASVVKVRAPASS